MLFLKQSTSVVVQFGPFVDKTDGVSLETGLATAMDNATTGIRLSKNGAAYADRADATAPSYDAMGSYRVTLGTGDTDTLGTLRITFEEAATCLPGWEDFMVMPANVWDSMFGADYLQVDTLQLGGATQSATDLKDFADAGYDPATNKVQGVVLTDTLTTYTGNTLQTGDVTTAINDLANATDGLSALKAILDTSGVVLQADQAVNATKLGGAAVTATTSVTFPAASTVATTTGAVGSVTGAVGSVTGHTNQTGDSFAIVNGTAGLVAIDTVVDAIKAVTDALPDSGALTTLQADTDDIQSRLPDALVGGAIKSDLLSISGSTTAADTLEASMLATINGTLTSFTNSTTVVDTGLTAIAPTNEMLVGRVIVFYTDTGKYEAARITAYTASTGTLTVTTLASTVTGTASYVIV